jgi:hypothetical protein
MLRGRETTKIQRVMALACVAACGFMTWCAGAAVSVGQAAQPTQSSQAAEQKMQVPIEHPGPPGAGVHAISVAFNYDFTKTPACSAKVTQDCVAKFEVYDISVPRRQFLLFSIAVPPGAAGKSNPIKATGPRMKFEVGRHRLGVSAVTPQGGESDPALCSTIVNVGPSM